MSTLSQQDKDFIDAVIPTDLLEEAIEWINRYMEPEEVFREDDLIAWAKDNGFVEDGGEV